MTRGTVIGIGKNRAVITSAQRRAFRRWVTVRHDDGPHVTVPHERLAYRRLAIGDRVSVPGRHPPRRREYSQVRG